MEKSEKHFKRLLNLVDLEEQEEIARFQKQFESKTPEERQRSGLALLRLCIQELHFSATGHRLVTFTYQQKKPLPVYSPDSGDVVSLSAENGNRFPLPIGTVYEKKADSITIALRREIPNWMHEEELFQINIAGNRNIYKKIRETLKQVQRADHDRLAFFRDLSLGIRKTESYDPVLPESISFFNPNLNEWQKEAVAKAMGAKDVFILHGPPGTGKTTALIELIRQTVKQDKFVFATAPSNTACDHLLEQLTQAEIPALRLGHPARIMEHLRKHTLDYKLAHHPHAEIVDELEAELERLYTKRRRRDERYPLSSGERRQMGEEIRNLKTEIKQLGANVFSQVMGGAPVIVGTHTSSTDPILRGRKFDLLVMDEASQSTEPSSWIPLLQANKVILAGDHFQLPPTVLSKEAEVKGLGKTLFERFHQILGDEWKILLRVQYRMHEKIMNFSSQQFYESKLIAHDSVKNHSLADLKHVKRSALTEEVLLFLDTAGRGFEEALELGSESRFNREEAEFLANYLKQLLETGVKPEEIAVISPYSAQVRLLSSLIANSKIEVDSVDGFQGREKEVVLLSLVRSNVEGEMGFLTDTRRMNVAMTRARRKLFVIGDSSTLSNIQFYQNFINYTESIEAYRSSWEES